MSKAVRWQVPFVSVSGTKYRVDIYDETGSWSGVTRLLAGDQPFVTDEDASDDYFAPVRSQSGTLQVCTKIEPQTTYPSGGTLSLNDILPANNIAHPVRLVSIAANNAETIEWQGFLSCEAYNQDYVGIPQNLSLSLISVLEAMDSVEIKPNTNMAFKTIMGHVAYALQAIVNDCGISDLINQVFISAYCRTAMTTQYIYNNAYFEQNEIVSGDNITVEVHSLSCKQILEQVAKLFGACWREKGQNIYMAVIGVSNSLSYQSLTSIYNAYVGSSSITWLSAAQSTVNLTAQTWMGTGHQLSVLQGMRRVMVKSNLKDFELNLSLQECPFNSLVENPAVRQSTWGEVHANTNETFYSLAEHKSMQGTVTLTYSTVEIEHYDSETGWWTTTEPVCHANMVFKQYVQGQIFLHTQLWEDVQLITYWKALSMPIPTTPRVVDYNMTSFMAYVKKNDKLYSGLMVVGAPADGNSKGPSSEPDPVYYVNWYWTNGIIPSASNYVFKQMFWGVFSAPSGYIRLNVNTLWQYVPQQTEGTLIGDKYHDQVWLAIKFGNKWIYKDGTTYKWGSSFNFIRVGVSKGQDDEFFTTDGNWDSSMNVDEGDGLYFPITSNMIGEVSVYIYPKSWSQGIDIDNSIYHFGTFITKLDIDYVPLINNERPLTDRSENVYSQSTSKNFRDTLDLSLDLASDANNLKQASLLWNNATTPAKLITLNGQSIRPEVDLLNRLAAYYGAARQRLELEVAHPTAAPLPLLKLNGINDGKVYRPLSESRDWQTGVCKLTCFETPT